MNAVIWYCVFHICPSCICIQRCIVGNVIQRLQTFLYQRHVLRF